MTPQLQQAIKMLQLSNLELNNFVDAEIQQNPLLERREWSGDEAVPTADATGAAEQAATAALPEGLVNDLAPDATEHWHASSGAEGDGSFDFAEEPAAWRSRSGTLGGDDRPGLEHTAARPRTLREHVLEQIGTDLAVQGDQLIAL
ncbi:MAG: RNA polymerase sigma-54 factor, partial [Stellaceae bacterium]